MARPARALPRPLGNLNEDSTRQNVIELETK